MSENNAVKDGDKVKILQEQLESLEEKLKEKEKEIEQYKMQIKRLNADFYNYKQRQVKQNETLIKYANLDLLKEIINIVDHFERIVDSINKGHKIEDIKEGMNLVLTDIKNILKNVNVKEIETIDKEFNPQEHEVVEFGHNEEKQEGIVLKELRKGYKLEDKIIRPALVKINKKEND